MTAGVGRQQWTRRRWFGTVTGVLVLQLTAVAILVRPTPRSPTRPVFGTRVHLVPPDESDRAFGVGSALEDPALFALPSLHGFSGAAWLRYPLLEPKLEDPALAPEWLKLAPGTLGIELARFLSSNTIAPLLLVDEPLPSVLRYVATFSGEPVAPASRLRIVGGLSSRSLIGSMDLPSWAHSEIVSNTVIRAAVDAVGLTFSATVISRSGLSAADDYALQFVENARFRPSARREGPFRPDELSWGTFVFLWHTRPLTVTNAPSVVP